MVHSEFLDLTFCISKISFMGKISLIQILFIWTVGTSWGSMKTIHTKDGGIALDFKISHAELMAVGHGRAKRGLPGRSNIFWTDSLHTFGECQHPCWCGLTRARRSVARVSGLQDSSSMDCTVHSFCNTCTLPSVFVTFMTTLRRIC